MNKVRRNRAVFLDRDGTINIEKEYLWRIEDFVFLDGAPEAIRRLNGAGYLVVVVTNQSGVARGYYSLDDVARLHAHVAEELARQGASVQGFYVCPHHPDEGLGQYKVDCQCRKGRPGLLLQAAGDLDIDLSRSFVVGDKISDVEAAENAGCMPILVQTGYGKREQEKLAKKRQVRVCRDLPAAVEEILSGES